MSDINKSAKGLKIGILQTDWLVDELAKDYAEYPQMFQDLFAQLGLGVNSDLKFTTYDVTRGELPNSFDEDDVYLITGSKKSVYEKLDWIKRLEDWLRAAHLENKKLLGICFGHQLLAQALGGEVKKSDKGWGVGLNRYELVTNKAWMRGAEKGVALLASHQDQVIRLPENAELILSSEFCLNAAFAIGDNILSIQAHPEFTLAYSEALMEYRRNTIPSDQLENGLASIKGSPKVDNLLLANWMLNFFIDA